MVMYDGGLVGFEKIWHSENGVLYRVYSMASKYAGCSGLSMVNPSIDVGMVASNSRISLLQVTAIKHRITSISIYVHDTKRTVLRDCSKSRKCGADILDDFPWLPSPALDFL